ncbi:MAG: HNH endonuclease [Syntrophales bacterium]
MIDNNLDQRVRLAAFDWLSNQIKVHGDVISRSVLAKGLEYDGRRVPLIGPQGIFKPQLLPEIPLSITTVPSGPYDDSFSEDNFLLYRYRGTNPHHRDNAGLRRAMFKGTPLIYLHGIVPGKYLPIWPVFIVGDYPDKLTFKVSVDDLSYVKSSELYAGNQVISEDVSASRRAYITSTVRQRLHQRGFRERVLHAYRQQCACCRLRHQELLDAAHIIPDIDPAGVPEVKNGIALCKLHHAAFDSYFLAIRPDYIVEVRKDIMEEEDGPMLMHGLQGLHHNKIVLPTSRHQLPDPMLLERRYTDFRKFI